MSSVSHATRHQAKFRWERLDLRLSFLWFLCFFTFVSSVSDIRVGLVTSLIHSLQTMDNVAVEEGSLDAISYDDSVPYQDQILANDADGPQLASRIGSTKVYLLSEASTSRVGKVRWLAKNTSNSWYPSFLSTVSVNMTTTTLAKSTKMLKWTKVCFLQ